MRRPSLSRPDRRDGVMASPFKDTLRLHASGSVPWGLVEWNGATQFNGRPIWALVMADAMERLGLDSLRATVKTYGRAVRAQ